MKDVCKVCGCTDDNACITEEGHCHLVMKGLCSACYIELPPGENCFKGDVGLIIAKECRCCANLEEDREAEHLGYKNYWHCTKGRYDSVMPDGSTVPGSFAWSGISRPNKAVARAQKKCTFWEVHLRYKAQK